MRAMADDWAHDHLPSATVLELTDLERDHFKSFNVEYGRFVGQVEVEFTALVDLIDAINFVDRAAWPRHRAVQYALVAYNVKTFYSALDRLVRGYYVDCITLTRSLYEAFVRLLFISCYPDDAYSALSRPPKGVRSFNLTNFLDHDLGLEWESKYDLMSGFAHSNSMQTLLALDRAIKRVGEPERFGLSHKFDPTLADLAGPFLNFALVAHLRFATERLADDLVDLPQLRVAHEAVDLLMFGLRDHPKQYWQVVSADLDLLFRMLPVADARQDWKAFLAAVRAPGGSTS